MRRKRALLNILKNRSSYQLALIQYSRWLQRKALIGLFEHWSAAVRHRGGHLPRNRKRTIGSEPEGPPRSFVQTVLLRAVLQWRRETPNISQNIWNLLPDGGDDFESSHTASPQPSSLESTFLRPTFPAPSQPCIESTSKSTAAGYIQMFSFAFVFCLKFK